MRRVIFYQFYDPQAKVDDFVLHKLGELRRHAEHIFVVSSSRFDEENRRRMESVSDTVWERDNVGFDVWGFKEALVVFGADRLKTFDELILMNCTFFGPIGSFAPSFARADADQDIDFWGLTEHAEVTPHPFLPEERMPAHVQSHWIAVRAAMFTSEAFTTFWDQMPMTSSYLDAVSYYEARFTQFFHNAGFRSRVLFPQSEYPSMHPIMDTPALMLRDGCPILKRRTLFRDSLYLESRAINGREITDLVEASGYPIDHLYANLARTAQPRALATNLGLLEILPSVGLTHDTGREALRVAAVAHIYYPEMTDEILDRLETIPGGFALFITTPDNGRRKAITAIVERRGHQADVRVVDNRGRDISAFFVGCRDVIESDDYDLIVKLHSKKSPQDDPGVSDFFKRHLFDNLLGSPGYTANVLALFDRHRTLGMVFPPAIHVGYPTLGHAWFSNKEPAEREAARLDIHVPFDDSTPLSAYGSMLIARPAALRPVLRGGYTYDDFPDDGGYLDGARTHTLERLMSYAALNQGFHVREVMSTELAAVNYRYLEYKHQAVTSQLPGYPGEQIDEIARLQGAASMNGSRSTVSNKSAGQGRRGPRAGGPKPGQPPRRRPPEPSPSGAVARLKNHVRSRPVAARVLHPVYRAGRSLVRVARNVR